MVSKLIEDNKTYVIERLRQFELQIVQQLESATKHLDLEAYDESITRLEHDVVGMASEFANLKQQHDDSWQGLSKWKQSLQKDFQLFYEKYDAKVSKAGGLSDSDRKLIQDTVN